MIVDCDCNVIITHPNYDSVEYQNIPLTHTVLSTGFDKSTTNTNALVDVAFFLCG